MDALTTDAHHPDAQLAWVSVVASVLGWFGVAALVGALWFASLPPAPRVAEGSAVHALHEIGGIPPPPPLEQPRQPRACGNDAIYAPGRRWIEDRWSTPMLDIVPVDRFSQPVPVAQVPTFQGFGALGLVLVFGCVPALAFGWLLRTRPCRVKLTARQLQIGQERYLLESEADMTRARRRLDELELDEDLSEALARLQRRLVVATLPPQADLRALQQMRG